MSLGCQVETIFAILAAHMSSSVLGCRCVLILVSDFLPPFFEKSRAHTWQWAFGAVVMQAGSKLVQLTAALARPSGAEVGGTAAPHPASTLKGLAEVAEYRDLRSQPGA